MKRSVTSTGILSALKRLLKNDTGNVTIIFGLAAIPIICGAGAAIDLERAVNSKTELQASVDAATLYAASLDDTDTTALTTKSKVYFDANYHNASEAPAQTFSMQKLNGRMVGTASAKQTNWFMNILGQPTLTVKADSEVVPSTSQPVELALVMDTTGSMSSPANNTDNITKIEGAKTAALNLLSKLYGGSKGQFPESENIRVSLTPFTTAVRLDQSAYDFDLSWIDTTGLNPLSHVNFTDPLWNNYMAWSQLKDATKATVTGSTSICYINKFGNSTCTNVPTYSNNPLGWNGCVETRKAGAHSLNQDYNVNIVAPTVSDPDSLFPAYFAVDAPSGYGTTFVGSPTELKGMNPTTYYYSTDTNRRLVQGNQNKYSITALTQGSGSGPWSNCDNTPIVPLTYSRTNIEDGVTSMSAGGNTIVSEGLSWGWRTISYGAPFTKVEGSGSISPSTISQYNNPSDNWHKVIVLMTDGDNNVNSGSYGYNNSVYSGYGLAGAPAVVNRFTNPANPEGSLDQALLQACSNAKEKNVEIYVAAFGVDITANAQANLQACATDASHYIHATSSDALNNFFSTIGDSLHNLYVAK